MLYIQFKKPVTGYTRMNSMLGCLYSLHLISFFVVSIDLTKVDPVEQDDSRWITGPEENYTEHPESTRGASASSSRGGHTEIPPTRGWQRDPL